MARPLPVIIAALDADEVRADRASRQLSDVANLPDGSYIETDSGPVPSIAEWYSQRETDIDNVGPLAAQVRADAIQVHDDAANVSSAINDAFIELAAPGGSSLIGSGFSTVEERLDKSQIRVNHKNFANNYSDGIVVIRDGQSDGYHRHFGGIAEGIDGRLHLWYRRAPEHANTSGVTPWYCYSDDGAQSWSAEIELVPPVAGFDQGGMSFCVTPKGTVVFIYDQVPSPLAAGVSMWRKISHDNGLTWSNSVQIASIPFSFARAYGRIKLIPGSATTDYRLAWTPYWQATASPNTYTVPLYTSVDDGDTWAASTPIHLGSAGYNETEMVAINATTWFAVGRGTGLNLFVTRDGGATWARTGTIPTVDGVSPSLDKFYHLGKWYLVLAYCDRSLDTTIFKVSSVEDALISVSGFGAALTTSTDMVNASGYQTTVVKPDGNLYLDGGLGYVEFKEYLGFPYSQVRFRRVDLLTMLLTTGRPLSIASGVITMPTTNNEQFITLSPEGSETIDDLDTINGGISGQVWTFTSATSTRDCVFKNGTGNLVLENDFRLNTAMVSWISLKKCGNYWIEIGRSNDHSPAGITIVSGAITVPSARYPIQIPVDTEASAAADDLDTVNGGLPGQIITFFGPSSSRRVTYKDMTGNMNLAGDFIATAGTDRLVLQKQAATWYEISRSKNTP